MVHLQLESTVFAGCYRKYNTLLVGNAIPPKFHNDFKKWLRFYLDFCKNYGHPYYDKNSLSSFIKKLKSKMQNSEQQSQAKQAIQLYYSGVEAKPAVADQKNLVRESSKGVQNAIRSNIPWIVAMETLSDHSG